MISRRARLAALEKAYKPHVLSTFRFTTWIPVGGGDEREGTHLDIPRPGAIGEIVIYAAERRGYCRQREQLRSSFTLLEG
jgi:hypothetical protein